MKVCKFFKDGEFLQKAFEPRFNLKYHYGLNLNIETKSKVSHHAFPKAYPTTETSIHPNVETTIERLQPHRGIL